LDELSLTTVFVPLKYTLSPILASVITSPQRGTSVVQVSKSVEYSNTCVEDGEPPVFIVIVELVYPAVKHNILDVCVSPVICITTSDVTSSIINVPVGFIQV